VATSTPAAATPGPTQNGSSSPIRAEAEAACAEAFPDDFRDACVNTYIETWAQGLGMTKTQAIRFGFPFRVCIWPDGYWTYSPAALSGGLAIGELGCGEDGKAKVTAILVAPKPLIPDETPAASFATVLEAGEAACAGAFPDEFRDACVDTYVQTATRGAGMSEADAIAFGFPFRVCIWPDGYWTFSPAELSGSLDIGELGCGEDGKAIVTAILEAP
jgi:hypothetical protein